MYAMPWLYFGASHRDLHLMMIVFQSYLSYVYLKLRNSLFQVLPRLPKSRAEQGPPLHLDRRVRLRHQLWILHRIPGGKKADQDLTQHDWPIVTCSESRLLLATILGIASQFET